MRGFLRKCQPPECQRLPGGHERQGATRAQCQAKKTGKIEEMVANATKCTGKGIKNSAIIHIMWREVRARCSIVRLAKRRESFGEQSLADLANLPLTGRGPLCLMEPNAFCATKIKVGPCRRTQKGSVLPSCIGTTDNVDSRYSEYSAVRQFPLRQKLRGTRLAPWTYQPGSKLVPKRTRY